MAVNQPNILFIFPDQHRWDWGPWNSDLDLNMPNLAALAKRGVRFENVVCSSPLCAPSRACLAQGLNFWRCGVNDNGQDTPLDGQYFYRNLRDAGYEVCGVGKVDLHKGTAEWHTDGSSWLDKWGFTRGIDSEGKHAGAGGGREKPRGPYMAMLHQKGWAETHADDLISRDRFLSTDPTPLPEDLYSDNWIAQNCLDVLGQVEVGTPWFMQINYTGPHEPNDITQSMWDSVQGRTYPQPWDSTQYEESDHVRIRQNYAAMIENIDRHTGAILAAIAKRGELDNTIVVYSSDHGEALGDHDCWEKSHFYQGPLAVPLVIAGPGIASGAVSEALVQINDLGPTFLDLAGAEPLDDVDGASLRPVLEGRARGVHDYVYSGLRQGTGTGVGHRGLALERKFDLSYDGRYKFVIDHVEGNELLFDRQIDPSESENRIEELPEVANRLRAALARQTGAGQTSGPTR